MAPSSPSVAARLERLVSLAGRPPGGAWFVPGRLEVLGKHTDYAGGRSLVCAVERGFVLAAAPRDDGEVVLLDAVSGERAATRLDPALEPPERHWARYPAVVARRLARNFPDARRGADIVFESDLPAAAGLASSSAFMIAFFLALAEVNALARSETWGRLLATREDLAGYLAAVENGAAFGSLAGDSGVGTRGGSEDHTAILCSEAGRLKQYAYGPVRHERTIALAPHLVFVIAASGVIAEKTGAAREAYNRASALAARLLEIWCAGTGSTASSLAEALSSDPDAADWLRRAVRRLAAPGEAAALLDRLDHFVEESLILVPAAAGRLAAGDLAGFGELADRSQALAERLLRNQVPETVALARLARSAGAPAASAFGAGFGGSVWALVAAEDAAAFVERWSAAYRHACPRAAERAAFFVTRPGAAAGAIDL
ncbi:MAG TPA: galactokinase family protein [Vicinamibacterales bacterium]|nr:galactokinase family protein [Vicinamibacterales bacterium]